MREDDLLMITADHGCDPGYTKTTDHTREHTPFIIWSSNIEHKDISKQMQTTLSTLRKYSKYIKNTLEYSYNNGVMERNNNTCKLIKRISFGFRNFRNMKSRIMIITNIFRKEKREYCTKYTIPKFV